MWSTIIKYAYKIGRFFVKWGKWSGKTFVHSKNFWTTLRRGFGAAATGIGIKILYNVSSALGDAKEQIKEFFEETNPIIIVMFILAIILLPIIAWSMSSTIKQYKKHNKKE